MTIADPTPEQVALLQELGYEVSSKDIEAAWYETWKDDRFDEVSTLHMWERMGVPAQALLIESKNAAEYQEKCRTYRHR